MTSTSSSSHEQRACAPPRQVGASAPGDEHTDRQLGHPAQPEHPTSRGAAEHAVRSGVQLHANARASNVSGWLAARSTRAARERASRRGAADRPPRDTELDQCLGGDDAVLDGDQVAAAARLITPFQGVAGTLEPRNRILMPVLVQICTKSGMRTGFSGGWRAIAGGLGALLSGVTLRQLGENVDAVGHHFGDDVSPTRWDRFGLSPRSRALSGRCDRRRPRHRG